jgi:hypothetical protein
MRPFFGGKEWSKDVSHFIPFLTGSKTPTSRFKRSKEDKWEITARKDPTKDGRPSQAKATGCGVLSVISFANHQWRMKKTPTDGSLTLFFGG